MTAPSGIKRMYERPSYQAMTSGARNEPVPDQSVFLKYLIDWLANNTKKYLNARTLFSDIQLVVSNNSKTIPQFGVILEVGDEGGDFIFIKR
ncbi:MAG TPA: hypothetical protein ENK25_05695 [Bacteroidetes bacterium]|nr:hypothetical protein [Bacteroidota bacterium]